ncbi:sterol esterase tgl1 [Anaeramoeba flamelloides]|uniref:Sterol esterase tgl1 n=1 Tax=Anaeramoeba flamelloides TaxID=1746091 RepID=A0AAV8AGN5_9EUKA|nr:sterol esterase tgl1 [Anaeramoeba flamelloides]
MKKTKKELTLTETIYEFLRKSTLSYIVFAIVVFFIKICCTLALIPITYLPLVFKGLASCVGLIKGGIYAISFNMLDQFHVLYHPIYYKFMKKTNNEKKVQKGNDNDTQEKATLTKKAKINKEFEKIRKKKIQGSEGAKGTGLFAGIKRSFRSVVSHLPFLHNSPKVRSIEDLVIKKGYPLEHHTVETEDGHYLRLFRIPSSPKYDDGKQNGTNKRKPVAFFMHGLLTCGTIFVVEKALALQLADQGYDIWLGNGRGGHNSQKHRDYDREDDRFWSHNFDDTVQYDFPSMVNFILDKTGQEKLNYFGFSQGSSQGFAAFSKFPEMNQKCNLFVGLAPTAIVNPIHTVAFKVICAFPARFQRLLFGNKSIFEGVERTMRDLMSPKIYALAIRAAIWFLFGFNTKQLNNRGFDNVCQTLYSPQSTNLVIQWFQQVKNEGFKYFDYEDEEKNLKVYGKKTPPDYDLSNIKCPVALIAGNADPIPNMKALFEYGLDPQLVVKDLRIDGYEHLDILFAHGSQEKVYDPVIELMNKHNFEDKN